MKKTILLLLAWTLCIGVHAQLTLKQVCAKAEAAMDISKGMQGKITMKVMGIGETASFETDGNGNFRLDDGEDVTFVNDEGVTFDYEKDKNTVTMEEDEMTGIFFFPFYMVKTLASDEADKNVGMEKEKSGYVITLKSDAGKLSFTIDAQSFLIKEAKVKKGILTMMTMTYSNLARYQGSHPVVFDKSMYPNAKLVDKRKKK